MSPASRRGRTMWVVVAVIVAGIYLAGLWVHNKMEQARKVALHEVEKSRQAKERLINNIKQRVEVDGGVYHDGIGIVPSAYIGSVLLKREGGYRTKEAFFSVELVIWNYMLDQRTIEFRTWSASDFADGGKGSLTDNLGKSYALAETADMNVLNTTKSASVKGHKMVRDTLVFEAPEGEFEYVDLRLPAVNVGGEGVIEIRIPADKIRRY